MSKVRTIDGLEAFLTSDLKWREAELDTWIRLVSKSREHEQVALLRGGIAILYSHWEGYIKEASRAYLEYVSRQGLQLGALSDQLAAVALRSMLGKAEVSKSPKSHTALVRHLRNEHKTKSEISYDRSTIRTDGNLNYDRFVDIMHSLGCDGDKHKINQATIDTRLLKLRNKVAHGQSDVLSLQDWQDIRERISAILKDIRSQLSNAANTQTYRL